MTRNLWSENLIKWLISNNHRSFNPFTDFKTIHQSVSHPSISCYFQKTEGLQTSMLWWNNDWLYFYEEKTQSVLILSVFIHYATITKKGLQLWFVRVVFSQNIFQKIRRMSAFEDRPVRFQWMSSGFIVGLHFFTRFWFNSADMQ